ncbi:MAG: hypothetical protein WCE90_04765 [Candidatus Zixiibacteriota bacterium]
MLPVGLLDQQPNSLSVGEEHQQKAEGQASGGNDFSQKDEDGMNSMNQKKILEKLEQISIIPKHGTDDYRQWLEQEGFLQFLLYTAVDETPLYISYKGTYIYSVFLPQSCLKGNYIDDLMKWDCGPDSSWGFSTSSGILQPFDFSCSKLLRKATPITFLRSFEGKIGQKSYVEIHQLLSHIHGLHFLEERKAYCCLNKDGDIEEVIKIHHLPREILVTIKQDVLNLHLFLAKSVLLRLFNRTLCNNWISFSEKTRQESKLYDKKNKMFARQGIAFDKEDLPTAGWLSGFQIIRNHQMRKKMQKIYNGEHSEPEKYEQFIAYDWKHKRIAKCSCDPKNLGNYFVESDKPFETSPVFFKPEVLSKYKQNPEKYTLEQRSIRCRGSWSLKTYDINEAGQVHTYLIYLGYLPHSEQIYWKSYNEKPKAGISKRAFTTDFMGTWDLSYEPLSELKKALDKLGKEKSELWSCTDAKLYECLNYPVTDSVKEWTDEIHTLDKFVIEGFRYSYLKEMATSLNCFDKTLGTIKLLRKILETKRISDNEVTNIVDPLEKIRCLRTKFAGHSSGNEANKIRRDLIGKYGNLRNHFRQLVERTDKSIKTLYHLFSIGDKK